MASPIPAGCDGPSLWVLVAGHAPTETACMELNADITEHPSASSQRVLHVTAADAARLLAAVPNATSERELPGSVAHGYLDALIVKPWGHELRVYDDRWMDVWRLAIEPGKGTSLHAHPRKDTCLICIGGAAVLTTG